MILADSLNPHSIYLSNGVYSPSTNGEHFPLNMVSYVSLFGESEDGVILDADSLSTVVVFRADRVITLEELTVAGGYNFHYAGGIDYDGSNSNITNVTISGNYASGINCGGSSLRISNATINGNISAGMRCYSSNPFLENVTINENTGDGINCNLSNPILMNVTVSRNMGSGVRLFISSPILANVTITGNEASEGGGIYCAVVSNPILVNTILWNNSPQEINFGVFDDPQSITIAYSDVQGGLDSIIMNDNSVVNWLEGNIDSDPLFVNAENGVYNLQEGSPAIDAGTTFFVWEGDTLVDLSPDEYNGNAPDIGAFESPYTVGVDDEQILPKKFALYQNYPNPFNPVTSISYQLPNSSFVNLSIYSVTGQLVETLVNEIVQSGYHKLTWNAVNVGSGVYFYRITAGKYSVTGKCLLIK